MPGWLGKVLQIILKVGEAAVGIEPIIAQAVPQAGTVASKVLDDLTSVSTMVQNGLAVIAALKQNLTPEAEAAAIAPLVGQALLRAEILAGKKVKDEAGFATGCGQLAGAIKQILSSVEG